MSTATPPAATPAATLRARLQRLAREPIARGLFPAAQEIVAEAYSALVQLDDLERRVAALERGLASLVPQQEEFE